MLLSAVKSSGTPAGERIQDAVDSLKPVDDTRDEFFKLLAATISHRCPLHSPHFMHEDYENIFIWKYESTVYFTPHVSQGHIMLFLYYIVTSLL